MARVDDDGWAYKGSQLQFQLAVNRYCVELNDALKRRVTELNGSRIRWRAPIESEKLVEPREERFLHAAGLDRMRGDLEAFWPRGGPVWDGVAQVLLADGASGVLLVEAKSYPGELESACRAEPDSRSRIEQRLAETRLALSVEETFADAWLLRYYQLANRLAHLVWLQASRVSTWLVLVGFTDDVDHVPTTSAEWEAGYQRVGDAMGLDLGRVENLVHLELEARRRPNLLPAHEAYLATEVGIESSGGWVAAGDAADDLGGQLHVLTAWNPGDERPSVVENRGANERLRAELVRRGLTVFHAVGSSSRGHAEESYAVPDWDRSAACELGREFGQVAIFEVDSESQTVVSSDESWEYSRPV